MATGTHYHLYKLCTYVVHKRDNLHLDKLMSLQSKTLCITLLKELLWEKSLHNLSGKPMNIMRMKVCPYNYEGVINF